MSNSIFVESSEMILKFQGIVFEDFIHENNFETKKDILFYRCTFKNPIILENITSREITFFECIFEKEFYLQESRPLGYVQRSIAQICNLCPQSK